MDGWQGRGLLHGQYTRHQTKCQTRGNFAVRSQPDRKSGGGVAIASPRRPDRVSLIPVSTLFYRASPVKLRFVWQQTQVPPDSGRCANGCPPVRGDFGAGVREPPGNRERSDRLARVSRPGPYIIPESRIEPRSQWRGGRTSATPSPIGYHYSIKNLKDRAER